MSNNIKKEFEEFASKISRLEALRNELDSLNTRGFENEANVIRAKLRNVNAIPEIELALKELEKKIKNAGEKSEKANATQLSEHRKIKGDVNLLKEELRSLQNALATKKHVSSKKQLSEQEVEYVRDIPEIEHQISDLISKVSDGMDEKLARTSGYIMDEIGKVRQDQEKKLEGTDKRIKDLQEAIEQKKRVAIKKQLSSLEVHYVKDIPMLENELIALKKKMNEKKAGKIKIDTGVGVIVDSRFDEFLSQIKIDIASRLKEKETIMDAQLKAEMDAREKLFSDRYNKLNEEFETRYKKKLDAQLKKEVEERFNQELNKRLDIEKILLAKKISSEHKANLEVEKTKLRQQLDAQFADKEKRFNTMLAMERAKIIEELEDKLNHQKMESDQKIRDREKIENELKKKFDEEKRMLIEQKNKLLKHVEMIGKIKDSSIFSDEMEEHHDKHHIHKTHSKIEHVAHKSTVSASAPHSKHAVLDEEEAELRRKLSQFD